MAVAAATLECDGSTDQGSCWTYADSPGLDGLQLQFVEAGSVVTADGAIVSDMLMTCGPS